MSFSGGSRGGGVGARPQPPHNQRGGHARHFLDPEPDDETLLLARARAPQGTGRSALGAGAVTDELLAEGFGTTGLARGFRRRRESASSTSISSRGGGTFGGGSFGSISTGFPQQVS